MNNKLKVLRAMRNWSQAELAERLLVSRQAVNAIETGKHDPSLPLAFKLARLFEMPGLETAVLNRTLRHNGSPVLRWNIANVTVTADPAGNRKLDKSKSTGRIDGAVATAMALRQAQQALDTTSVYEERGIFAI